MYQKHCNVVIIGSGPAGFTASIYLARALLDPLLITGTDPGGQLTITTEVENYPGYSDPVQGPWIMQQMQAQAINVGAKITTDHVNDVGLDKKPFHIACDSGKIYTTDALIIATGAKAKWLGLESEKTFMGAGVSACATCDGFFYRNKCVLVVGGGNTAVEEALYLSNLAHKVTLIHRRETLRAERILQKRLFSRDNVEIIWNTELYEVTGKKESPVSVTGAILINCQTGEKSTIKTDGIFIAIGHKPAVELFDRKLKQKSGGYLWTAPDSTATEISGVFAAGDVTDNIYRQAVTAAGMGCMAALEAEKYLTSLKEG